MFDPNVYSILAQNSADAAAAYLAANTPQPVTPAPAPPATPAPAPQAQPPFTPPATAQPAAPVTPPARGSLSQAYNQGARAGGYGNTVKFPVVGSRIAGYVARDSLDTDVTQETDFATKAPKFNKDGSEMWQVTVPLDVAVSAEYPEGKGTWWAKGRGLKSFTREQAAKGYAPGDGLRQGDYVEVVRTADSPTTFGSPAHEYQVTITRRAEAQVPVDPTPATPVSAPPAALPPSATPATPSLPTPPAAPAATTTPTPPAPTATPATTTVPAIPGLTPEQAAIVAQYTSQG